MENVEEFNKELNSINGIKPPISKAKIASIVKLALKATHYYKYVVQSVEKFIWKCKSQHKLPGLYVIDAIIHQARVQFKYKDVYAPRFARNLFRTFNYVFQCPDDDRKKVMRVLNLWSLNDIFKEDVLKPIFELAETVEKKKQEEAERAVDSDLDETEVVEEQKDEEETETENNKDILLTQLASLQNTLQNQNISTLLNTVKDDKTMTKGIEFLLSNPNLIKQLGELQNKFSINQIKTLEQVVESTLVKKDEEEGAGAVKKEEEPRKVNESLLAEENEFERFLKENEERAKAKTENNVMKSFNLADINLPTNLNEINLPHSAPPLPETAPPLPPSSSDLTDDLPINFPSFNPECQPPLPPPPIQFNIQPPIHKPPSLSIPLPEFPTFNIPPPNKPLWLPEEQPPPLPPLPSQPPTTMDLSKSPSEEGEISKRSRSNSISVSSRQRSKSPGIRRRSRSRSKGRRRSRSRDRRRSRRDRSRSRDRERERSRNRRKRSVERRRRSGSYERHKRRSRSRDVDKKRKRSRERRRSESGDRRRRSEHRSRDKSFTRDNSRSRDSGRRSRDESFTRDNSRSRDSIHPREPSQPMEMDDTEAIEREGRRKAKGYPPARPNHITICTKTLWVGHLPKNITENELRDMVNKYGQINSLNLIPPRGCAYINMTERISALNALEGLRDKKIGGKNMQIDWAPGKYCKDSEYKQFWDVRYGATYLPYSQIENTNFESLIEGCVFDFDTVPEFLRSRLEMVQMNYEAQLQPQSIPTVGQFTPMGGVPGFMPGPGCFPPGFPPMMPPMGMRLPPPGYGPPMGPNGHPPMGINVPPFGGPPMRPNGLPGMGYNGPPPHNGPAIPNGPPCNDNGPPFNRPPPRGGFPPSNPRAGFPPSSDIRGGFPPSSNSRGGFPPPSNSFNQFPPSNNMFEDEAPPSQENERFEPRRRRVSRFSEPEPMPPASNRGGGLYDDEEGLEVNTSQKFEGEQPPEPYEGGGEQVEDDDSD